VRARDIPFATARVHLFRYRLPQGLTWEHLLARLAALNYRAALVGPEGSGKTTLLEDLAPRLRARGFVPRPLRLDAPRRILPPESWNDIFASLTTREVILLDGAEQLGRWAWLRFQRLARCAGGLVITSHRPGLLPTLLECGTTLALLDAIVDELLAGTAPASDLATTRLFLGHRGNIRSALRELYDRFAALPGE
jgi:hypothetical protein